MEWTRKQIYSIIHRQPKTVVNMLICAEDQNLKSSPSEILSHQKSSYMVQNNYTVASSWVKKDLNWIEFEVSFEQKSN